MTLKNLKMQTLYNSIINYLTKKGNKQLAKKLFHNSLIDASKKAKLSSQYLLALVFKKLSVSVEVKDVHRRGKTFKIPFFINLKRQRYLSIK
jgi:ribosomal protein S7